MCSVELFLGDSHDLDANADSHCEPTFNREQDPSRRVSHPATCHALTWASVLSPDDERPAQVPTRARLVPARGVKSQCSVAAIREAFSGLGTDAVPVQCLNVR